MATGITSASGKPVKAYIWNEDKNQKVVDCLFNPTEYSFSKSNTWSPNGTPSRDLPVVNFQSGGQMSLSVSLLFDTYSLAATQAGGKPEDVRT